MKSLDDKEDNQVDSTPTEGYGQPTSGEYDALEGGHYSFGTVG